MRLQLRSSLVKPAKKVIGKQRLTVLVNVSFPAPMRCIGWLFERIGWFHVAVAHPGG